MKPAPLPLLVLCFLAVIGAVFPTSAQVAVSVQVKRASFLPHEPILATVSITNLSGRPLQLEDGRCQWFGFQIYPGASLDPIAPRNPDYHLTPLPINAGESLKRTVNLNTLFPLGEEGRYRVKALIYSNQLDKFFASKSDVFDIAEGKLVWRQKVGVPEGLPNAGATHAMSVLNGQVGPHQHAYARVEDTDSGTVYCTLQLGEIIENTLPDVQLDSSNNLFVLQLTAPKSYILSKIGVNGEFLGQTRYTSRKSRPYLRRLTSGELQIVGAYRETPQPAAGEAPASSKLSERPPGLPQ
jgi:hypothetical protein